MFNKTLILVITSPNKDWSCHKSTINVLLPILKISFLCWTAPPMFAELSSQSQTRHSEGSCLCHQWQYLTLQRVVPDVTLTLLSIFFVVCCVQETTLLAQEVSVHLNCHWSTTAVPRHMLPAQLLAKTTKMQRLWWWVWWQFCSVLYELFKAVKYYKEGCSFSRIPCSETGLAAYKVLEDEKLGCSSI